MSLKDFSMASLTGAETSVLSLVANSCISLVWALRAVELLTCEGGLQLDGFGQALRGHDVLHEGEGGVGVGLGSIDGLVVELDNALTGGLEGVFHQVGRVFGGGLDLGVGFTSVLDALFSGFTERPELPFSALRRLRSPGMQQQPERQSWRTWWCGLSEQLLQ
jgi:hypothetical protein